ncbi:MAG TPA: hypothetical protein VHT53_11900 [Candidatus Elarobacter sp.]|nr:hypothetical protein [Candidatus Elarobacter sp.]
MTPALRLLAVAVIAIAAGCSSAGGQCPGNPVAVTTAAPPQLVSPANGATGVPASGVEVEISYAPPQASLAVVAPDGTQVQGMPLAPGQGGITPPGETFALPPLAAHTTYTVRVTAIYAPAGPCPFGYVGTKVFTLGTFTTQ